MFLCETLTVRNVPILRRFWRRMGFQTICRTASKFATLRVSTVKILLLAAPFPSARLALPVIASRGFRLLDVVRLDDGRDQPGKALVDFHAA